MAATRLKEVAAFARVSVKTVSNVINDYPHVSADVRRRVQDAIKELNYRPNLAARALRSGRTGLVALLARDLDTTCLPGLTGHVIRAASAHGLRVAVNPFGPGTRATIPPGYADVSLRVDAALVDADLISHARLATNLTAGTPVVVLGETSHAHYDHVHPDAAQAARDAVNHLVHTGRRHIAAIGARSDTDRRAPHPYTLGYEQAVHRAGLRPAIGFLQTTTDTRHEDGYRAARNLFAQEQRPDGIFCYDDRIAIGAIRAAIDIGLRVPQDVAVVGVGDTEEGRYSRPTLTSVCVDVAFVAREALDLIATRLGFGAGPPVRLVAPHAVLPRESTGPTG
ncbi:LacI family DNA-binding transcriptional regulator [Micromonospora sp. NPDC051141]|uniref:LacI family DNA-binding transcriptional regulator n=1 Tax=Micromonospora sp. NPDC051141 TaxID=3364284 RepID=UPI003794C0D5